MKTCIKCNRKLPLIEFNKKTNAPDNKQPDCRECNRKRSRKYYKENKEKHLKAIKERKKRHRKEVRGFLRAVREFNGCSLCDEKDYCCIDFHHLDPKKKKFCIGY